MSRPRTSLRCCLGLAVPQKLDGIQRIADDFNFDIFERNAGAEGSGTPQVDAKAGRLTAAAEDDALRFVLCVGDTAGDGNHRKRRCNDAANDR